MANAGLSSTLSHTSWTKADWYGFFACFNFAMIVLLIQLSAFHILWQTRFYERITISRDLRFFWVPPSQLLALMMLVNHACIATGLFFLIYNFQHETGVIGGVQVHNAGNFAWVVGWLVASIFASWFVPMLVHVSCNLWWATIFDFMSEFALVFAFGYEVNYILQTSSPQLSTSSPALWLLIYPVAFKFVMLLIMIRAAVVSVRDPDYLAQCEAERGMVSNAVTAYNKTAAEPGDFDVVIARTALKQDDGAGPAQVIPIAAPASLEVGGSGISNRAMRGTSVPPAPKTSAFGRQTPRQ